MGEVIQFLPFKLAKRMEEPIRTREDAVDHLASELSKMLEEGDTLMVLPEPPADCPA